MQECVDTGMSWVGVEPQHQEGWERLIKDFDYKTVSMRKQNRVVAKHQ